MRKLKQEKLRRYHQRSPELYARQILNADWWFKQQEIVDALLLHKKVFVKAGNGPGKSFLAGGLVNWFYDTHPRGICLTTAPSAQQVKDVLWKYVRSQRPFGDDLQPKAPRMESSPEHYAAGYTASSPEAFQGRHAKDLFIMFDEATAIHADYWTAAEGMQPLYWLVMLNPTDTATRAYEEEQKEGWHVITLNGLDHPNVVQALAGGSIPFPESSLTLEWVNERVKEWCSPIPEEDHRAQDFQWPPNSAHWFRPGPLFEARVLGRWPSSGSYSVWSEAVWDAALRPQEIPDAPTVIGCDVARFGDDFTSIIVRRGPCALWHETHNGWSTSQTAGRLKQLCREFAREVEKPERIACHIDDDGVGGGVVDQKGEFNFVPCSSAWDAMQKMDYPNRRSEIWFVTAKQADEGRLDLSRLAHDALRLLRRQAMAPIWKLDSEGRRVVEPKADTKKRIGRSPDDMDALNLTSAVPKRMARIA